MQIILTLEPIEIVVDMDEENWRSLGITPADLARAAYEGIAELVKIRDQDWEIAPTVRPYIPPTTGVVSCEINPF